MTLANTFVAVDDPEAALGFYRDALGFTYERFWGDPPDFVILRRNGLHLMLSQAPAGSGHCSFFIFFAGKLTTSAKGLA